MVLKSDCHPQYIYSISDSNGLVNSLEIFLKISIMEEIVRRPNPTKGTRPPLPTDREGFREGRG